MFNGPLISHVRVFVGFLLLASGAVAADSPEAPAKAGKQQKSGAKSWKASMRARAEVRYDDNMFLLSDNQKGDLRNAGPAEAASGRFQNMKSISDYVFRPSADFEVEGPGIAGRKLALRAQLGYNSYFRNRERNHFEIGLSAEQATSKHGRTRFRFDYVPDYFQKNYLADATDLTGTVTPDERVYKPGKYSEWDMSVDYRHRLLKGENASLSGWVGAGYLRRRYAAPFTGRDRNAPHADLGVDVQLAKRWEIDFSYGLAGVDSPRLAEVLILDEPSFGVDFNRDSDASDVNVRTVQAVDRTHMAHRFQVKSKLEVTKSLDARVGYERRHRRFSSHEQFDINHNGRTDERDVLDFSLAWRLRRGLHLSGGYFFAVQDTNRAGDPAFLGEITDYRRSGGHVAFSFRF